MALDPLHKAINDVNRLLKEKKDYMSAAQLRALRNRKRKLKRAIEIITSKYRRDAANTELNT